MLVVETQRPVLPVPEDRLSSSASSIKPTFEVHAIEKKPIYTIDDLLCDRASDEEQVPLVAYPKSKHGLIDYEHFTPKDLDRFTDHSAKKLMQNGIAPTVQKTPCVVALLGPSDLNYLVSMFGLVRLGYTVFFLSTRLSVIAYVSLLEKASCSMLVHTPQFAKTLSEIQQQRKVEQFPMLSRHDYDFHNLTEPRYIPPASTPESSKRLSFIIHSSGSTGLPKPIFQTHGANIGNYSTGFPMRGFITLPLYHNHGLCCFYRSMYSRNEIFFYNANLPLTGGNLVDVFQFVKPEIFYGVPYALKLLGEHEQGAEVLKSCKIVLFGGSGCPDELGHRLVSQGVNLVSHYGSTETGQLMTSFRPAGDDAWDYNRILPKVKPYVLMDEIAPGSYECVVLDGLKSKTTSNSDNPPKSFRTRDLFIKHPTIPDAWKHMGRIDDRVTLMNGEKVLPLTIEGRIKEEDTVQEALVFGIGKAVPGLLVIRSEKAKNLSDEDFISQIWPAVEEANSKAEAFSRIDKEMIVSIPTGTLYPRTDKGTFIRAQMYELFAPQIDLAYNNFETGREGSLELDQAQLEAWLLEKFSSHLGIHLPTTESDFFSAGVDSLQAIKMWSLLKRELSLGGNGAKMTQNAVFEQQNVSQLARYLYALRMGIEMDKRDEISVMRDLIEKYSTFTKHEPTGIPMPKSQVMIITGTTGSLGAHILAQSLLNSSVSKVYCLVRAPNSHAARDRVLAALFERELYVPNQNQSKIIALASDFSNETLGLSPTILEAIRNEATCIIHSAWAVNFNLGVQSFESHHIAGTFHLLNLSLSSHLPTPPRFYFCSSISAAAGTPLPTKIPEAPITDLTHAQNMGYARSKLVTEHIVLNAAQKAGAASKIFRIGQIVGDGTAGLWNDTEAIPLMIRTAVTLGCLPMLDENPSWLPVDVLATSILELACISSSSSSPPNNNKETPTPSHSHFPQIYNLTNPTCFSWTHDLLPALHAAGLKFTPVSQHEWISRLRSGPQDPTVNPPIKLLDFFVQKYEIEEPGRRKGLVFETGMAERESGALRGGVDVLGEGYVGRFVGAWLRRWG
ncbi:MAG: putative NRPS-like protein biosynthetic cluster [Cirrosporium novae-zelandiae]|nr:MAG: putative NRPS-like protein biosynthetic cluster [Cirrosporium novae-zelandiae]